MNNRSLIAGLFILFFALVLFVSYTTAQEQSGKGGEAEEDLIEADPTFSTTYILKISGTVANERFSGVNAILTLSGSSDLDPNPYLLIIEGYPNRNTRNAFFWKSEGGYMDALSNEIVCEIKPAQQEKSTVHFFYLSPVLLKTYSFTGVETHREEERLKIAKKQALPTPIFVKTGRLKLRIYAETVSGTVWLTGYDNIEKSYVFYNAQIYGRKVHHLEPSLELKKSWR